MGRTRVNIRALASHQSSFAPYFDTWKGIDSEYITPVACSRTTRLQTYGPGSNVKPARYVPVPASNTSRTVATTMPLPPADGTVVIWPIRSTRPENESIGTTRFMNCSTRLIRSEG